MDPVLIASSHTDAEAVEDARQHHAHLGASLEAQVETLVAVVAQGDGETADAARERLLGWLRGHLVPHALAEEATLYPAARSIPSTRLLVDALLADHRTLVELVAAVEQAPNRVVAAAKAEALLVLFAAHVAKENEQILPALAQAADISLADLLDRAHRLLDEHQPVPAATSSEPACGCDDHEADGALPELDVRSVPHAIRHATVFGALDGTVAGAGIVLVAPHDPLPLLHQLERRAPGEFQVTYLERGPEAWRLTVVKR